VVFGQPFGVVFEPTKDLADLGEVAEYISGIINCGGSLRTPVTVNIYRGGLLRTPVTVNMYRGGPLRAPVMVNIFQSEILFSPFSIWNLIFPLGRAVYILDS